MPWTSLKALLLLCIVLGLYLWFRRVWGIMKERLDAVEVADRQRQEVRHCTDDRCTETASAVLERSENIFHQAVEMYEQALRHPLHRLPAAIMGFRSLADKN